MTNNGCRDDGCRDCRALRRRLQHVAKLLGVESDDPREDVLAAAVLRLRKGEALREALEKILD